MTTQFNRAPLLWENLWAESPSVKMSASPPSVSLLMLTFSLIPEGGGGFTIVHHIKDNIQCHYIWGAELSDTDPVSYFVLSQTFFIAVWRSQTCFLLQYSICVPSCNLHYNYTGCCLLETTFLPLHLLHLSTPFPYPSPSPPPRPPITLSPPGGHGAGLSEMW